MHKPHLTLLPLACLLASIGVQAQTAPDPAPVKAEQADKADQKVVPQVTVQGSRANDTESRRLSTAAKMVFGREELDRNGDSNIGEILKRLPGVTMGGPPGRGGGGVRMRGLGNGYTQLLVNGERPPAGFSIESLSPDQVERIEVMRGPVAEHSTQAIAGTINIVLREGYQQKDVQLKLADGIEQGRHAPNVSLTAPYKFGKLSVLLNGSIGSQRQHDESETVNDDRLLDGTLMRHQDIASEASRKSSNLHLAPRLSYKFDNGDTLNFQPFAMASRSSSDSRGTLDQPYTAPDYRLPPAYALALGTSESEFAFFRGFGNWLHRMDAGARIDVKFGFGAGHNKNSSLSNQFDASGAPTKRFDNRDEGQQHGVSSGGKYTAPMGKGHLLAAGWDVEWQNRSQSSTALLNGEPQFAGSGDTLDADTRRVALFVQDEWDVTPQFSTYLGLRWEGIRTTSSSYGNDVRNTSSVWSPVLHGVWHIPGHEKDQIRASLTQSYKAPVLSDLIAAPVYATVNQPTTPDRSGNPNLRPELAKGLDIAYEHYLGKSGILSASGFVRDIDDLQRRALIEPTTPTGRWLSTPSNVGHARTSGIELEAKFQLAELMQDAPNIDFRANYSHYWSKVDGIPAPDNRLDGQASQTANIGLDYRMKGVPLTFGGSYNWTPATATQVSVDERSTIGVKRQSDIYALWKVNPATQLRVSANNLTADDYLTGRLITAKTLAYSTATAARTYTTWTLRLEMKI